MDSWPASSKRTASSTQGKKKEISSEVTVPWLAFPRLEHGTVGAVTLRETSGAFEWTSLVSNRQECFKQLGDPVKIFPATRSPPSQSPKTSIKLRAEEGANFLRTHLPDIEIPAELIRKEIAADTKITRAREVYDSFIGNRLASLDCNYLPINRRTFLIFPMNETSRDLNISHFRVSRKGDITFTPSGLKSWTFDTPIYQITSASSIDKEQQIHLAVRTMASTSLFHYRDAHRQMEAREAPVVREIVQIKHSEVRNRSIVDVKICSRSVDALLVNDQGTIYKWTSAGPEPPVLVYENDSWYENVDSVDPFWRISPSDHAEECVVIHGQQARLIDFRANMGTVILYSVQRPNEILTSIEKPLDDRLIRLVSTTDIIWVDSRLAKRPLLSFKHGRNPDRTLHSETVTAADTSTFLMSSKNSLVTVYDVSRSSHELIQLNRNPYSLRSYDRYQSESTGTAFLAHPSGPESARVSMFRLSEQGSVYRADMVFLSDEGAPPQELAASHEWSQAVKALAAKASELHADSQLLDAMEGIKVDLIEAYRAIFQIDAGGTGSLSEEQMNVESVYETLENMPFVWQGSNVPLEHILTTHDVVLSVGDEPEEISRADFLTTSMLQNSRGYRALLQDRIVTQDLLKQTRWHCSIVGSMAMMGFEIPADHQAFRSHLQGYNLSMDGNRASSSIRKERYASEQLALDLGLSSDIFSSQPFSEAPEGTDDIETMAIAAGAMSLTDEPPPIHFGFFRPVRKEANDHYNRLDPAPEEVSEFPIGVRLLLRDWDIGTDPDCFVYSDPYDAARPPEIPQQPNVKRLPRADGKLKNQQVVSAVPQCPPLVMASKISVIPAAPTTAETNMPRRSHQSQTESTTFRQPIHASGSHLLVQDKAIDMVPSQQMITNTQVEPGPHGGRQGFASTKKPSRKRLGGF